MISPPAETQHYDAGNISHLLRGHRGDAGHVLVLLNDHLHGVKVLALPDVVLLVVVGRGAALEGATDGLLVGAVEHGVRGEVVDVPVGLTARLEKRRRMYLATGVLLLWKDERISRCR